MNISQGNSPLADDGRQGADGDLPSFSKGERRLIYRLEERLNSEGLAKFRSDTLSLSERGRERALNIIVEQYCSIITKAPSVCELSGEQQGIARAYSNFMRELGYVKQAKRIEACNSVVRSEDTLGIHQDWGKSVINKQVELGTNGDMIRVASGVRDLVQLLDNYPVHTDWIKDVVAQQIEKIKNGDMIRVASGLKDLVHLLDSHPGHAEWIKGVVAQQIEKIDNGDMIRVASGLRHLLIKG